jgi:hypothetical protein
MCEKQAKQWFVLVAIEACDDKLRGGVSNAAE